MMIICIHKKGTLKIMAYINYDIQYMIDMLKAIQYKYMLIRI